MTFLFPTLMTTAALLALFALAEVAHRRGLASETTRGVVHMLGAGTAALFPLYLSLSQVVSLALAFTGILSVTRLRRSLPSVHGVARPTAGALVFPAGILLAALVCWHRPAAFSFGALVLALADPAAALAGRRLPSPTWSVAGGRKSLSGSLAFFLLSLLLGFLFSLGAGSVSLLPLLATATLLTVLEAVLGYGLDNLPLPLLAGLLGQHWLGL